MIGFEMQDGKSNTECCNTFFLDYARGYFSVMKQRVQKMTGGYCYVKFHYIMLRLLNAQTIKELNLQKIIK